MKLNAADPVERALFDAWAKDLPCVELRLRNAEGSTLAAFVLSEGQQLWYTTPLPVAVEGAEIAVPGAVLKMDFDVRLSPGDTLSLSW